MHFTETVTLHSLPFLEAIAAASGLNETQRPARYHYTSSQRDGATTTHNTHTHTHKQASNSHWLTTASKAYSCDSDKTAPVFLVPAPKMMPCTKYAPDHGRSCHNNGTVLRSPARAPNVSSFQLVKSTRVVRTAVMVQVSDAIISP